MTQQNKINDFLKFEEGYLSKYIALADTKAMWLFTIFSGVLIYFAAKVDWQAVTTSNGTNVAVFFILAAASLLALAAALCINVVRPRTNPKSDTSVIFFSSVSERPGSSDYLIALNTLSDEQLNEHRATHCYNLAKVCDRKYRQLKWAIFIGFLGLIVVTLILILGGAL